MQFFPCAHYSQSHPPYGIFFASTECRELKNSIHFVYLLVIFYHNISSNIYIYLAYSDEYPSQGLPEPSRLISKFTVATAEYSDFVTTLCFATSGVYYYLDISGLFVN